MWVAYGFSAESVAPGSARVKMKKYGTFIVALLAMFASACVARAQGSGNSGVERLDPALDELVAADAKVELVKGGFGFTEGVTWVQQGKSGYLLFSDIPANVIFKMTPQDGKTSLYLDHSGYTGYDIWNVGFEQNNGKDPSDPRYKKFFMIGSNGLTLDRQGRLIIATWSGRSIARLEKNGRRTILADRYEGKRFGGPNDVVVKKDGAIYFTDQYGGLRLREKDPGIELPAGVYMIKDGKVTLLTKDFVNPNGLTFSPDEKVFYANDSTKKFVMRYDVQADDTISDGRVFLDVSGEKKPGVPDGMKVDVKGNVYESGPGGIWILTPEGKHLGMIHVPELVANLEWGDADYKTLYIAAREGIYKIRMNVSGIR
jgi:gluconolactonase